MPQIRCDSTVAASRNADQLRRSIENANRNGIKVPVKYTDALTKLDEDELQSKRARLQAEIAKLNAVTV